MKPVLLVVSSLFLSANVMLGQVLTCALKIEPSKNIPFLKKGEEWDEDEQVQ